MKPNRIITGFLGSEFSGLDAAKQEIISNNKESSIYHLNQIHSDTIHIVTAGSEPGEISTGDALSTDCYNKILLLKTADCMPIIYYSKTQARITAAHCGWRGIRSRLHLKALNTFIVPADVCIEIGPHLYGQSFQVKEDLIRYFEKDGHKIEKYLKRDENSTKNKYLFDMTRYVEEEFIKSGVPRDQIKISPDCTLDSSKYYSHRAGANRTQRNYSFIGMLP
ncbi:MAG: polyphenol oxidase family protein [Bdellovibrionales bacterium]